MITLGVDLASARQRTATCAIEWRDNRAVVQRLIVNVDDDKIEEESKLADVVGIDAPFGWPVAFADLVAGKPSAAAWADEHRDKLRFRTTDHHVRKETGRWPLSVSSDLIGVVAMRCQGLLRRLGVSDRVAHDRVLEVYPRAALDRWRIRALGYKRAKGRSALAEVVDALLQQTPWLEVDAEQKEHLLRCDDAFDALVASLAARAARIGRADPAPSDACVRSEGWIFLPASDSLGHLVGDAPAPRSA
jgi:predicted nuclease with RNAse H fold